MNRREFLINGASGLGSWLLGVRIAKQIQRLATEQNLPYLVDVDRPAVTLYANDTGDSYMLSLGSPAGGEDPPTFTWKQWYSHRGIDSSCPEEVLQYAIDNGLHDPADGEFDAPPLTGEIPEWLMEHYLEWEYSTFACPEAGAFHYLSELPLAAVKGSKGDPLGKLEFGAAANPGSNFFYVEAKDVKAIGCLQQRLIALGRPSRIVVV